jgi:translation initiation factor 3 subunit G
VIADYFSKILQNSQTSRSKRPKCQR